MLALGNQLLMTRILRCDLDGVKQVLQALEQEPSKSPLNLLLLQIYIFFNKRKREEKTWSKLSWAII